MLFLRLLSQLLQFNLPRLGCRTATVVMSVLGLVIGVNSLMAQTRGAMPAHDSAPTSRIFTRGEAFRPVPCSTFELGDQEFECGYVHVPEFHAQPEGRTLELAVAILPSTGTTPTRNAFVVAQGGPGGSAIDTFARFFTLDLYPALTQLRRERDIVFYDQRGTLYARPALICREEFELTAQTIDQDIPADEMLEREKHAARQCRERLLREGVNLAAYNSIENARDIQVLRRALGYDQFDFYGVSYATLLALHGLRETPTTFRSVILDAVVPPQLNPNVTVPETTQRAFERLFAACAADVSCNAAYPNLKEVFYAQVDALNRIPTRVPLTDAKTGKRYHAVLDGDEFIRLLFQLLYNSEVIPALPKMIYDARKGNYALLRVYWPLFAFDRTFAGGMYYSVICAEDADFSLSDLILDNVEPRLATIEMRETRALLELCREWAVPPLGAGADAPIVADVPALLLSGEFDPITPPSFGQIAAQTLAPSYALTFPAYGHGALTSGDCPNAIILQFVRNPRRAPDTTCIAATARVPFLTPATIIASPALGETVYAILDARVEHFLVPAASLVFLLSVYGINPLLWLATCVRRRPRDPRWLPRLFPWLAALAGAMVVIFFVLLIVIVLAIALTNSNPVTLAFGLPRGTAPLFTLPPLFALCALVLGILIVLAWRYSYWSLGRRIYYTLVAFAAFALLVWLYSAGLLTALFF